MNTGLTSQFDHNVAIALTSPTTVYVASCTQGVFMTSGTIVNKAATTTTIASSLNPSTSGQNVTFTATVSPPAATGTVQFFDGGTSLGTATLIGGSASVSTSALSVGSHSITATYSGDSTFA